MDNKKYYQELAEKLFKKESRDNRKLYDSAGDAICQLVSIVETLEERLEELGKQNGNM